MGLKCANWLYSNVRMHCSVVASAVICMPNSWPSIYFSFNNSRFRFYYFSTVRWARLRSAGFINIYIIISYYCVFGCSCRIECRCHYFIICLAAPCARQCHTTAQTNSTELMAFSFLKSVVCTIIIIIIHFCCCWVRAHELAFVIFGFRLPSVSTTSLSVCPSASWLCALLPFGLMDSSQSKHMRFRSLKLPRNESNKMNSDSGRMSWASRLSPVFIVLGHSMASINKWPKSAVWMGIIVVATQMRHHVESEIT